MLSITRGTASSGAPQLFAAALNCSRPRPVAVVNNTSASPLDESARVDTACANPGAARGGDSLHYFQREHLARDFGKALHASADVHEAFVVNRHDVAGRVPAITDGLGRLDDTGRS